MNLKDLKKLIREEMRTVIREELKDILTEAVVIASTPTNPSPGFQKPQPYIQTQGQTKKTFSEIINDHPLKSTGNPILDLLTETAEEGSWRNINGDGYKAQDAVSWAGGMPGMENHTPITSTAEEMITSAAQVNKHVSSLEDIQINSVPDFSKMMNKFKEQGNI